MIGLGEGVGEDGDVINSEDWSYLTAAVSDDFPTTLHWVMFVPNIASLCDDEQRSVWLPLCRDWRVIGCYAQTEIGHGSNVRGLETTATFLSEGRGVHNFIVPLRSMTDHKFLPGVKCGDLGPKVGYNNMDNGFASFDNVVIPRRNMAMRFASVDESGKYAKRSVSDATEKVAYITMMQVRAYIMDEAGKDLAKACAVSIRYSAVRRQGFADGAGGGGEKQILDYPQQQHRLLPLLASSYCFRLTGIRVLRRVKDIETRLVGGASTADEGAGADPVTKAEISDLHATSSALKSFMTMTAADGIEECRKACGGHGYLQSSGLPELSATYLMNPTVEGDNHMLPQQVM